MTKDYYGILGVARDADNETIKKAYRRSAVEWHPDKHQNAPEEQQREAEEKFKEISEAYAVLSDPEKKANYDLTGDPTRGAAPFGFRTTGDPMELFRHFGFRREPQRPPVMKGQSLRHVLEVSLAEALLGGEKTIEYAVSSPCEACGTKGGTAFKNCPQCKGTGHQVRKEPNLVVQTTCQECRGSGQKVTTVCGKCYGQGALMEDKTLNVKIPVGLKQGAVLRVAGAGGAGFNGGPPGDVLLEAHVLYPDLSQFSEEEKQQLKELLSK